MIKNYIKIAWRNLLKNKLFSSINIFGLAVGLATCLLLILYILDETSYDKHHVDGDRIYRVYMESEDNSLATTAGPMSTELKNEFPEIEQIATFLKFPNVDKFLLKDKSLEKKLYETNGYYVDSTFFQVLSYDFKYGNANTALKKPNTIVLSEETAFKFFGDVNPISKTIEVETPYGSEIYTIDGVFKTDNKSHINAKLLISMKNGGIGNWVDSQEGIWGNNLFHTYLKLKKGSSELVFEEKLPAFVDRHIGEQLAAMNVERRYLLQPIKDIYLKSNMMWEIDQNGSMTYIYIFSAIAAFLLIIACINFMNLSTARSEKRAKEVGMRKVLGANKNSLVFQFLGESLLLCLISLVIAIVLVMLFMPFFNDITNKELVLTQYPSLLIFIGGLALITGLLSGLYPAFYLSSFKPITVLKGKLINTISAKNIRKGLVVFQFTISAALILVGGVIWQQMEFLQNKDMGFKKERQLLIPYSNPNAAENYSTLKNELLKDPNILSATAGDAYPGIQILSDTSFYGEEQTNENATWTRYAQVLDDYTQTLGYTLIAGRDFTKNNTVDSLSLILNETAVRKVGYTAETAIGKRVFYERGAIKSEMEIIGVVKDFNFKSLHEPIDAYALASLGDNQPSYFIATLNDQNLAATIKSIESVWNKVNPDTPFEYTFLDERFNTNYKAEKQTSTVVYGFMLIAIFIACIGLFGLASFTTEQRKKEVGIRRVLGASIFSITSMQLKDFLRLVMLAMLVASPLAWFLGNRWLENFAYRISIGWQLFVAAAFVAILIAFITVGAQVFKAAIANPVKSLRAE
ncbi:FtsX-like permease family protein [Spongiivirga citrea]|uniref:FtsX-like permease family protein n=1 Tax=Spongiivirga citrea TaxID=1481457 RepID=A0A6M0CPD7_9FLAO|nr:FtsX-like permease family protein [Spongiivirga citrea]NER17337.1 FtsX-like permease family protein [Spongiivirga citrea]